MVDQQDDSRWWQIRRKILIRLGIVACIVGVLLTLFVVYCSLPMLPGPYNIF